MFCRDAIHFVPASPARFFSLCHQTANSSSCAERKLRLSASVETVSILSKEPDSFKKTDIAEKFGLF